MSLGYAQKLSCKEDVVTVGMSEIFDPSHLLQGKVSFSDRPDTKTAVLHNLCAEKVITDNINHDKAVVVQKLRNTATEDESWGQVLVVEREKTLAPKTETTVYAMQPMLFGTVVFRLALDYQKLMETWQESMRM